MGKVTFTDKLRDHLDGLDADSLQGYLLGMIKDRGFFEQVFNTIHEAVIVVDREMLIHYRNQAAYQLLGIGDDAVGAHLEKYLKQFKWEGLLPGEDRPNWNVSRREIEVFYPEHRFLSVYVMPWKDSDSDSESMATLLFNDITEMTEDNERQVETQKVKAITQLAAGVAHELGNPLNSLGIHLQLVKRLLGKCGESPELAKISEHLQVAGREIKRLDAIVKNFLTAVRPVPPEMRPLNIEGLLREAVGFMQSEIEDKGIWVELAIPGAIPVLLGDQDQLLQAAYNIIKNAIQAMTDGGQLRISVEVDDVYVNIKFSDTGCGFDQEQLSRLLEPYFTTKSSGNGLGLLIVDRIVRAHGGELGIEGTAGKGAVFTISLPRQSRMVRQLPLSADRDASAGEQEG